MRTIPGLLLALLLLATGCRLPFDFDPDEGRRPEEGERVWVEKLYAGGRQCEPAEPFTPPDVKRALEDAGVPVYETAVEPLGVCAACGCPAYAAFHRALIDAERLETARQLGFERR